MLAWVVINRQQPRQFVPFLVVRPSFPILEPSPLALSHSLDALCFKSVHQPFSNQALPHSFLKMPGCMGFLPCDMRFNRSSTASVERRSRPCRDVQTYERSNVFPTYPPSFHVLAHSFTLNKNSTPLFSDVSALFAKNHPGWGEYCQTVIFWKTPATFPRSWGRRRLPAPPNQ
jgi:hypothetical protein